MLTHLKPNPEKVEKDRSPVPLACLHGLGLGREIGAAFETEVSTGCISCPALGYLPESATEVPLIKYLLRA